MSDTTGTAERRLRDVSAPIQAVRDLLQRRSDVGDHELLDSFADIFLSRAPVELLRERGVNDLARMTLGAFRFLQGTRSYRVDVDVRNPEQDYEDWQEPVTIIRTNVSERPFIIDTIREFLHAEDLAIERMVYPMLDLERDAEGRVVSVRPASDGGTKESLVHCEVSRIVDPDRLEFVRRELTERLQDVVRATDDFGPMLNAVDVVVDELGALAEKLPERAAELGEIQAFMRWLKEGGFVFLGYRAYDFVQTGRKKGDRSVVVEPGSGLGMLRNEAESRFADPVPISQLGEGVRRLAETGPVLIINKTNAESTVHRRARMDYIGVKKMDGRGRVVGEHRFIGLFTSKAYAQAAENIPILRHKLAKVLEDAHARAGSHDYKEIITIFNTLPKEELFLSSAEEVADDVRTVQTSYGTDDVRVTLREDPLERGLSVMVILPRDRFSADVRKAIGAALVEAFDGEVLNYHLALGEGDQARLHFYVGAPPDRLRAVDAAHLEEVVGELIRTWSDRVREGLEDVRPADEARGLARRYGAELSLEYQAATAPSVAVGDILELERMRRDGRTVSVVLANRAEDTAVAGVEGATELKLFLRGRRLVLSDFMPILEAAGLRVLAMKPFEVGANGTAEATVYVFAVQDAKGRLLDVGGRGELLSETLLASMAGDVVSDKLNALVVAAGLHWREVDALRGYVGYAFQIGAVPSRLALPTALVEHPGIASELLDLFKAKFDPDQPGSQEDRLAAVADIRAAFHASLRSVSLLSDDRALRRLEELISGTLRTNYYRRGGRATTFRSGGVPYISYKFGRPGPESTKPTELRFEIWVHSSRMEGIHLRGGRVARGGIRWSDRADDFRKEVLGLVRTQMVKNAVIVPSGSKGGFVTRRVGGTPEERFLEAKEQYRTLIRGMLDITDNLVDGQPVLDERVIPYDPPDPYLVVAADKGTATFSDVANAVAEEYGFWLGDAFASGGSHGYDHKAVAITARGAWECVRRHFREKGKDIHAEPFTVAGIGDMSGDVFGNGMLLSPQIRLIAAFDHRHVFIDPDPDPARSFEERERMFGLERSSWDDYDRAVLSEGGMIVPRGAKEVELTPEARRALGMPDEAVGAPNGEGSTSEVVAGADGGGPPGPAVMDGETLIRAVLKAPVELLWNGGIGTYVKADSESHADAGDPANDAVRVNASELRCETVGEGGNLGFTQRARIQYALAGGRVNTDALDNSAGVDMSDHEVNLKILLAPAVAAGTMSPEQRNELLEELTEPVAQLVLENNRAQSLAVSLDERRAREGIDDFRDLMFSLEKAGELERAREHLPSLDVLVERRERGQSLCRPELCVLLAYAKLSLKSRLLRSGLPDDPVTESYLLGYFPPAATVSAGREDLARHRLRREVIVSQLTNDLVGLMGSTFVNRMMRDTGSTAEQVARAWLVASRLADHRALLGQMAQQKSGLSPRVSSRWLLGLARVLERTTRWVLQNVEAEASPARIVEQSIGGLAKLRDAFGEVVAGEERALFEARVREIQDLGADEGFSRRLITLRFLDQLLEVLQIARDSGADPVAAARAYYEASELFDVPWLRRCTFAAAGDDQWEHRAAQVLSEDISRAHRRLVLFVLRSEAREPAGTAAGGPLVERRAVARGGGAGAGGAPADGSGSAAALPGTPDSPFTRRLRARDVERFRGIIDEIKEDDAVGLAAISVAARELSALADRMARSPDAEERR